MIRPSHLMAEVALGTRVAVDRKIPASPPSCILLAGLLVLKLSMILVVNSRRADRRARFGL